GQTQKLGPDPSRVAFQGAAEQGFALVPDGGALVSENAIQGNAPGLFQGHAVQTAHFAADRPENHRCFNAFAAQPLENAQGVLGVALEQGVGQAEDVETGAV